MGVDVVCIEKPNLGRGVLTFLYYFVVTPFFLIYELLKHPKAPVHIVGFYENQLLYEYMMYMISSIFGRKKVYELRNGTMVKTYHQHSWLYRKAMRKMIENAEVVLCQGMEFVDFIQKDWMANTLYYPNYIMRSFIHPYDEQRANKSDLFWKNNGIEEY